MVREPYAQWCESRGGSNLPHLLDYSLFDSSLRAGYVVTKSKHLEVRNVL